MGPRLSIVRAAAPPLRAPSAPAVRRPGATAYRPIVSFAAQTVYAWVSRAELASALAVLDDRSAATKLLVSPTTQELFDASLPAQLKTKRLASQLMLVLSERTAGSDLAACRRQLELLRTSGVSIALDGLGVSAAGLTTFAALSPELVKLDLSLVRDLDASSTKRRLVGALVSLCGDSGALVVGEGIETRAEAEALAELGCDLQEGYYYAHSAPSPPEPTWFRPYR